MCLYVRFGCRTRLRRLIVLEANRIFKLKRAVLMLETCALKLQLRWLKHRYPFGLPKYRHRRNEAAMLLQSCWRGYKGRQRFKAAVRVMQKRIAAVSGVTRTLSCGVYHSDRICSGCLGVG